MFDWVNIPLDLFENLCAQKSCKDLDNSFISNKHLSWIFNPLSAIPTKWSNTLKPFVGNSRRMVWVCLIILWAGAYKRVRFNKIRVVLNTAVINWCYIYNHVLRNIANDVICIREIFSEFRSLTQFRPMFPFYNPWKHQKTKGFLVFSGGIKWEHWPEMS